MQFTGENVNTWGIRLNSTINRIDYAIAGWLSLPVTANTTLTTSNSSDDQARAAMLKFTGAGGFSVTIPSVSKHYIVQNAATLSVIITTGSGATVTVDPDDILHVVCDGTNVYELGFDGLGIKAYIASVALGASGALPATAGNAGKYVYTDGSVSYWKTVTLTDLSDWPAEQGNLKKYACAVSVALAA
jgi:hypothetical protein